MRSLPNICILLFSFLLVTACSEEKLVINEIPIEDRCIFSAGDTLLYKCSNGSTDTVFVRKVFYRTESGTHTTLGNHDYDYVTDEQEIIIEASNDTWISILNKTYDNDWRSQSFTILKSVEYRDIDNYIPRGDITWGDNNKGFLSIAANWGYEGEWYQFHAIKIFNNKSYQNVYSNSRGDKTNGFEIYWNFKYGIISFTGISNGQELNWFLEDKDQ